MSAGLGFEQTRKRNRTHFFNDKEAPDDASGELQLFGERIVKR